MMRFPGDLGLRTARLVLRPVREDDVDLFWPDIADADIARLMAWDAHVDRAQTAAFLRHERERERAGRGVTWALLEDGAFRGIVSLIGLLGTHRALTYDRAELAYWVGRAHQRRGLMAEAGSAVLDFAFGDCGLHKLHVAHFGGNDASKALIARLGFRLVGVQRQEFRKAGVWHDQHLYELLAQDHRERQP